MSGTDPDPSGAFLTSEPCVFCDCLTIGRIQPETALALNRVGSVTSPICANCSALARSTPAEMTSRYDAKWSNAEARGFCCVCGVPSSVRGLIAVNPTGSIVAARPAAAGKFLCVDCSAIPPSIAIGKFDARQSAAAQGALGGQVTGGRASLRSCCCCGRSGASGLDASVPFVCTDCLELPLAQLLLRHAKRVEASFEASKNGIPVHQLLRQLELEIEQFKKPIPLRLECPSCHELHIDVGAWETKPHHTHSCQNCGLSWRPAVVHTVGVRFLPGFKNTETPS